MKKILIGLLFLINCIYAKEGYVDVNVLLIKKYPSDESIKLGYYSKYSDIDVLDTLDGIDNNDKWYKTIKGYVRAQYVTLNEDLPKLLMVEDVDTSKNAVQLAVYPKSAKNSFKDAIKKLIGEENIFMEETSRAKVLYLVNFPSYRDAVNKLKEVPFKGFVTKVKLKNSMPVFKEQKNKNVVTKENIKSGLNDKLDNKLSKVQDEVLIEKNNSKDILQEQDKELPKEKAIKKVLEDVIIEQEVEDGINMKKVVSNIPSRDTLMSDDDMEIDAIMKKIDNENYADTVVKKPKIEKVIPKIVKESVSLKQEEFITLKTQKHKKSDDFNMDKELTKTLENALLKLDKL